jgi:hypothetical protein
MHHAASNRTCAIVLAVLVGLCGVSRAATNLVSEDFEDGTGYGFYDNGSGTGYSSVARLSGSGEPAKESLSAFLSISDDDDGTVSWVGAGVRAEANIGKLRNITDASFEVYNKTGTSTPYMSFRVDVNGNGAYDGIFTDYGVIAASQTIGQGENGWRTVRIDNTSSTWHVFGTTETYWGDTLAELVDKKVPDEGDTLWGDLDVIITYVEAGTWNRDGYTYEAYVDNIAVNGVAIPEPMTMLAFGSAVAGLGGYIRRRRRA